MIAYRDSALSTGQAGQIAAGDRLPWVEADGAGTDNFDPLSALDWQVQVYGEATPQLQAVCERRRIALHLFAWGAAAATADFSRDSVCLVRPDGYIADIGDHRGSAELARYLDDWSLQSLRQA